jgi:hypothetical protein
MEPSAGSSAVLASDPGEAYQASQASVRSPALDMHPPLDPDMHAAHATQDAEAHPALQPLPLLERYMKLRASGHHVSEEEEAEVMRILLGRAAQVHEYEQTGVVQRLGP